jgi:hypothetical protein
MNRRKELTREYKERKSLGGVYKITNQLSGKYIIDHTANLKSVQNHFQFAEKFGGPMHLKLKKDWEELGGQAFKLEILEELEQGPDQSQAQFIEDLKTLEQLQRANFDASKEY